MDSTLEPIISIPCRAESAALFDFHVRGDLLVCNNETMLSVINTTNANVIAHNSIPGSASCISFVSDSVVVYANMTYLMQYDFINNVNMSSSELPNGNYNHMINVIDNMIVDTINTLEYPFST